MTNSLSTKEIVALRPQVTRPAASRSPIAVLDELEAVDRAASLANVTTVLLRGSECSFRCTMCDLWKETHLGPTPRGNMPAQIREALARQQSSPLKQSGPEQSSRQHWIKLYNASNFFAPYNVPTEDLPEIAQLVCNFDRVIVENHPSLTAPSIADFAKQLNGRLEVAMGLETVDPQSLRSLNKQVTVDTIRSATHSLIDMGIDVRLFVLLRPPGLSESAAIESCLASVAAAQDWGARHVSIIPVRGGNGAMEYLQQTGGFEPPLASSLEFVLNQSLASSPIVVTADTWDWDKLRGQCAACSAARRSALERANLAQVPQASITCENCPR